MFMCLSFACSLNNVSGCSYFFVKRGPVFVNVACSLCVLKHMRAFKVSCRRTAIKRKRWVSFFGLSGERQRFSVSNCPARGLFG
jgi:hypothetical protein